MKPVKSVAHITPYSITFPLASHNGRYDWMIDLASRQAQQGLAVAIYSNPLSHLDIPGVTWKSIGGNFETSAQANQALLLHTLHDKEVDIFHSHFDSLHYTVSTATQKPIVFTQHWWPTEETIARAQGFIHANVWAVPPTQFMLEFDRLHGIQTKGAIYHGVDLQKFRHLSVQKTDRLLFVGRIAPEKNLPIAIAAAKKANVGLDIIGKVAPKNRLYWESLQSDIDGEQICYLGTKSAAELLQHYNTALAVIFPSDINEPFGLVAIESQACGTPVLMKRGGSRGELLRDGTSGFLCDTVDDFAEAALRAHDLSADECVAFASSFDVNHMVAAYGRLYDELVA